jgi:hypothetical protein
MIHFRNRALPRWCVVLAMLVAAIAMSANFAQSAQDRQKLAQLTSRMKTICVGRFLIDLPAEATVRLGRGFISGYDVSSTDSESDGEFATRLSQLETSVLSVKGDGGMSASVSPIASGEAHGKVFEHNRRPAETMRDGRRVTIEDVDIEGMLRLSEVSLTASAEAMAPGSGAGLARVLGQFRAMHTGEIPREPGFCLGHAIVRDPFDDPENESVVMFAGLPGHPDVNIVLSSMAGADPAPRLLERHAKSVRRSPFFLRLVFSQLREAARTIHGLDGDELVMKVREMNFTTGYSFQWEMPGRQDDVNAPLLMLELDAGTNPVSGGKPVRSSLSEGAMIGLWDKIAGSIRLRQTAPQVASTGEQRCSASFRTQQAGHKAAHTDLRPRCGAAQRVGQAAEPSQPTA